MADEDSTESDAAETIRVINEASAMFDELCQERHDVGKEEYGPLSFLGNDIIRMMMEELADTANYCRMQFVKLVILQTFLEEHVTDKLDFNDGEGNITMGFEAFKGTKDVGWKKP